MVRTNPVDNFDEPVCRPCSVCVSGHHWLPVLSDDGQDAWYECKHCPAITEDSPHAVAAGGAYLDVYSTD